jgi:transposase-like protein
MLRVHVETSADAELSTTLDELVAEGARRMLAAALEAEVDAYLMSLTDERDDQGRRLVVRNGHAVPRSLVTGAGPIEVRSPRVDDRRVDETTGERMRFRSSILPPWARKSPKVAEVLPLMYLHGMSPVGGHLRVERVQMHGCESGQANLAQLGAHPSVGEAHIGPDRGG